MLSFITKFSPVIATKYIYRRATGEKLNLKNPKNFNEKIQWLKLYWKNPLIVKCADKYEVRKYVIDNGFEEILNEMYGIYNNTSEIEWETLPDKFALKTTNGCGTNIICNDKGKFEKEEAFGKLDKWLKKDYGLEFAEIHYSKITPRIISEKYIETDSGLFPIDYKIFCFNGKPEFIYVGIEREKGLKRVFMDLNWNKLDITKDSSNNSLNINKPETLDEMLYYAEVLSRPFPFVRIDFYNLDGKVIFGEMTFTPSGGLSTYYKDEALEYLGEILKLPAKQNFKIEV